MSKPSITRYQCSYETVYPWVTCDPKSQTNAVCSWCNTTINIATMGKSALNSHARSKKHKVSISKRKSVPINIFLQRPESDAMKVQSETSGQGISAPCNSSSETGTTEGDVTASSSKNWSSKPSSVQSFLLSENVTKAEILCCLRTIYNHLSIRTSAACISSFPEMFPDSQIATKMQLQRTKIGYSIVYGIAPYVSRKLNDMIKQCDSVVLEFDESLNTVSQKTQMDIHVRFWDKNKSQVSTRYFDSAFIQRTRASNVLGALKGSFGLQNLPKILQLSMDGPNVNFRVWKDLNNELKDISDNLELLQLGSCSLHVVHGAFKTGMSQTNWEIARFLRSLYYLFHDSPTRRSQYTESTGSSDFPLKFCGTIWIENANVAERALKILPQLRNYISQSIQNKTLANSASFKTVSDAVRDKFLGTKLAFFAATAHAFEEFLSDFQSDVPMAPFLYNELFTLTTSLMQRVVRSDILLNEKSLTKIDMKDKKTLITAQCFVLDFSTQDALRKVEDHTQTDILRLKEEMRSCIVVMIQKLLERSPLKYKLTRAISCLDPAVTLNQEMAVKRLTLFLEILVSSERLSGVKADRVKQDYINICSNAYIKKEMVLFKGNKTRLDDFWMNVIQFSEKECGNFVDFLKIILILSRGNAVVERSFSVNSECIVENQSEKSLVAQRHIYAAIHDVGGVENFKTERGLILSMRNASSLYKEDKKRQLSETERQREQVFARKRIQSEINMLESKKTKILAEAAKITAEIEHLRK